jgi:hypothetical protein
MLVWVLSGNPFREFYENLGGKLAGKKLLNVCGADLQEVAYGWPDLRSLLPRG